MGVLAGNEEIACGHVAFGLGEDETPEHEPGFAAGGDGIGAVVPGAGSAGDPIEGTAVDLLVEIGQGAVGGAFGDAVGFPKDLGAGFVDQGFLHAGPVATEGVLPGVEPDGAFGGIFANNHLGKHLAADDAALFIAAWEEFGIGFDLAHGDGVLQVVADGFGEAIAEGVGEEGDADEELANVLVREGQLWVGGFGFEEVLPKGDVIEGGFGGGQQAMALDFEEIGGAGFICPTGDRAAAFDFADILGPGAEATDGSRGDGEFVVGEAACFVVTELLFGHLFDATGLGLVIVGEPLVDDGFDDFGGFVVVNREGPKEVLMLRAIGVALLEGEGEEAANVLGFACAVGAEDAELDGDAGVIHPMAAEFPCGGIPGGEEVAVVVGIFDGVEDLLRPGTGGLEGILCAQGQEFIQGVRRLHAVRALGEVDFLDGEVFEFGHEGKVCQQIQGGQQIGGSAGMGSRK